MGAETEGQRFLGLERERERERERTRGVYCVIVYITGVSFRGPILSDMGLSLSYD